MTSSSVIFIYLRCVMDFCLQSKIGEEQLAEDAEDGPPELLVSNEYNQECT